MNKKSRLVLFIRKVIIGLLAIALGVQTQAMTRDQSGSRPGASLKNYDNKALRAIGFASTVAGSAFAIKNLESKSPYNPYQIIAASVLAGTIGMYVSSGPIKVDWTHMPDPFFDYLAGAFPVIKKFRNATPGSILVPNPLVDGLCGIASIAFGACLGVREFKKSGSIKKAYAWLAGGTAIGVALKAFLRKKSVNE